GPITILMSTSSRTTHRDLIAGETSVRNYPVPRRSRAGAMLLIPNAINTATLLSTRVHLRQSAFRSLITSSQKGFLALGGAIHLNEQRRRRALERCHRRSPTRHEPDRKAY